jgi:hypothetical protein
VAPAGAVARDVAVMVMQFLWVSTTTTTQGRRQREGQCIWLRGAREESSTAVWVEVSPTLCVCGGSVGATLCSHSHMCEILCSWPPGCTIVV